MTEHEVLSVTDLIEPGTICLVLSWRGWPCCYGRVGEHGLAFDDPLDVYYAVEALTPVIDWSLPDPAMGYVARRPGDVFNHHHRDLLPLSVLLAAREEDR